MFRVADVTPVTYRPCTKRTTCIALYDRQLFEKGAAAAHKKTTRLYIHRVMIFCRNFTTFPVLLFVVVVVAAVVVVVVASSSSPSPSSSSSSSSTSSSSSSPRFTITRQVTRATHVRRPPSESHWCGRIRGMVARELLKSVTRNVVV